MTEWYFIEELLEYFLRELGSDYILKDVLCWKGSLIFTAYKIWEKSFVEGLNFSSLTPNWYICQIFCAIEILTPPNAGTPFYFGYF